MGLVDKHKRQAIALIAILLVSSLAITQPSVTSIAQAEDAYISGDIDAALQTFEEVARTQSSVAPDALFRIGQIWEEDKDDPGKAVQYYRQILLEYPASTVAAPASRRVKRLETAVIDDPVMEDKFNKAASQDSLLSFLESHKRHTDYVSFLYRALQTWSEHGNGRQVERYVQELATFDPTRATDIVATLANQYAQRGDHVGLARLQNTDIVKSSSSLRAEVRHLYKRVTRDKRLRHISIWLFASGFAVLLIGLFWGRPLTTALWPPPSSVVFLAPLAVLFVGLSWSDHVPSAKAISFIWLLTLTLSWIAQGVSLTGKGPRLMLPLGFVVISAGVIMFITAKFELIDYVVETFRHGPG